MTKKDKNIYIQDDVINNYDEDNFGHKHIADAIVNSIITTRAPFTIGIFGGWGSGKSSLVELINSKLQREKYLTVTIDAWRYSSAENLRRAFLVHVANELAPNLLNALRRKLYSSEQETVTKYPSRLEKNSVPLHKRIFQTITPFLGWSLIFLIILFLIYSINGLIANQGFSNFFDKSYWGSFINKFLDLAYIPLTMAIINYLQVFVIQHPVTIIQERIDADELFTEYFDKIINEKLKGRNNKDKLIIFIDNLDRLNDNKMVEALESLKTYLVNKHCVFIVTCDDNVVRSVINKSPNIPLVEGNQNGNLISGEHYLDKFFQQTFRLPEYMSINLIDYALENFKTTELYEELVLKKVDIHNIITIILPSDVNSPRKVKRLLNEFIALYEIIKRRENEKDGQLKTGILTDNIEFLAKFSTLRSEYPDFYKELIKDSTLIRTITDLYQFQENEKQGELESLAKLYTNSLIAYLRKTQTILIEDIDPFIWLSQDTLSLGLKSNHNNLLRTALADGNVDQVKLIIDSAESNDYRMLLIKVASRIVEQRLLGIEQANGVKVISHLLPNLDESIKPELAHIATKLIPLWPGEHFSAYEVMNVLRWAKMGGINSHRDKLIKHTLDRLNEINLRQETFEVLLDNADVIELYKATELVRNWLKVILSDNSQDIKIVNNDGEAELNIDINEPNRIFAEWFIAKADDYSNNSLVIRKYYSDYLMDYIVKRLLNDIENIDPIYLGDGEDLSIAVEKALNAISIEVSKGFSCINYWEGLRQIIERSLTIYELTYSLGEVIKLIDNCPIDFIDNLFMSTLIMVHNISNEVDDNGDNSNLENLISQAFQVILKLRIRKNISFNNLDNEFSDEIFTPLLTNPSVSKSIFSSLDSYLEKFGSTDIEVFSLGFVNVFSLTGEDQEIGTRLIKTFVKWDQYISTSRKEGIIVKINDLFESNSPSYMEIIIGYLLLIVDLTDYRAIINNYGKQWLSKFNSDEPNLLNEKLKFYTLLVNHDLLNPDDLIEKINQFWPYTNNQLSLGYVIESINKIDKSISDANGVNLFIGIISCFGSLGPSANEGLILIARWVGLVDESYKMQFSAFAYQEYSNSPIEIMKILLTVWPILSEEEIKKHLINFYTSELNEDGKAVRSLSVKGLFKTIEEGRRASLFLSTWNSLVENRYFAESFIEDVLYIIPYESLKEARDRAILYIRDNGASDISEQYFRFLGATIRSDTREIMPTVDLFINIFGRGQMDVEMALKYVIPCIKPLDIRNDHKHKLAEAMGNAALRTEIKSINQEIHEKAEQLGLMWFSYRKYWKE